MCGVCTTHGTSAWWRGLGMRGLFAWHGDDAVACRVATTGSALRTAVGLQVPRVPRILVAGDCTCTKLCIGTPTEILTAGSTVFFTRGLENKTTSTSTKALGRECSYCHRHTADDPRPRIGRARRPKANDDLLTRFDIEERACSVALLLRCLAQERLRCLALSSLG